MGKRLRDEDLRLNIIVNGDSARKQITDMSVQIRDLRIANQELRAEQKQLAASGQKESAQYKELSAQIKANSAVIKDNQAKLDKLRASMDINCMTMDDLNKRAASLRISLRYTVPGTEQWDKYASELKKVIIRQAELKKGYANTGGVLNSLAGATNKYFGAIYAGLQLYDRVRRGLENISQSYLQYDEAITRASRTTNLTKEEVEELSDTLRSMDTRTSQNELIDLIGVAGKLGISGEEDILGFVSAADKINVALSEDLGGDAEDALKSIGKLVDIFKLKEDYGMEQSMLKVGSAINSLGMASTANEGYIVDFAQQMAGIAPTANMSIPQVLGLAATLDSLGQRGETATTALTNVIGDMFKKTAQYAKVAGMSLQDFENLLSTDVNEALLLVLEGAGAGDTSDTIKALESLGLSGSRATTILGSLSQNVETLRYQQELAKKAFDDGTSAIEEYDRMNNTATATMEKAKKAVTDEMVAIGAQLNPATIEFTHLTAQGLKIVASIIAAGIKYRAVIYGLTAAYITHNGLKKAKIALDKLSAFWSQANRLALTKEALSLSTATTGTMLLCAAKNLLVGNLKAARVAMNSFWASMGPIGWVTLAVGSLVSLFGMLATSMRESADSASVADRAQKGLDDALKDNGGALGEDVVLVKRLSDAWKNLGDDLEERKKFIDENKEAFDQLGISVDDVNEAERLFDTHTNTVIEAMRLRTEAAAAQELAGKAYAEALLAENRLKDVAPTMHTPDVKDEDGVVISVGKEIRNPTYVALEEEAKAARALADAYYDVAGARRKESDEKLKSAGLKPSTTDNGNGTGGNDDVGVKWSLNNDKNFLEERLALKKEYQDSEDMTQEEFNERLLQLEIDAIRARLAANKESGAERVALEEQRADKLIQQNERQKKQEQKDAKDAAKAQEDDARKREKINQDIAEMSGNRITIEKAKYEKLKREYAGNERALEALEKAHKARLAKIQLEAADKEIDTRRDAYEIARVQMLNRHRQEMETFSGSERARREKRKKHWAELNALDEKYLNEMITTLTNLVDKAQVGNIKIEAELSDADKAKLLKQIEDLRQQLDKLKGTSEDTDKKSGEGTLFGLSQGQWKDMFSGNIEGWQGGADNIATVVGSMGDQVMSIWGKVDDFMAAKEKAQLKEYEKNNDKKKSALEKRLNAGLITEAQYNAEIEAMDAEYEAYQEELALKQAKRQKAMNLTQAIINTAVSVTQTLAQWGLPWGLIPAGIAAAMGAAEIALIASQPITTGAEDGGPIGSGLIDVR